MRAAIETAVATVYAGDCIEVLRADENGYDFGLGYGTRRLIPDESIDAVVTDPPYGLSDASPSQIADVLSAWASGDRTAMPKGSGFMGRGWDAFVPPPAVWDECFRVLKPGGHLLAFAGSRTDDLMGISIRLAGFEIRDSIAWLYGSGFPKSLDVSKAIDKRGGNADRAFEIAAAIKEARTSRGISVTSADAMFCGSTTMYSWFEGRPGGVRIPNEFQFAAMVSSWPELAKYADAVKTVPRDETGVHRTGLRTGPSGLGGAGQGKPRADEPSTRAGKTWEGWGTALKPSFEPIVVGRKPLAGTVAQNVLAHGTGALNIDGCRVAGQVPETTRGRNQFGVINDDGWEPSQSGERIEGNPAGRWPSNVVLSHSPLLDEHGEIIGDACADGCVPGCAVAELDAQSGVRRSGVLAAHHARAPKAEGILGAFGSVEGERGYGDEGGASRFYPVFRFEAKAPTSERPRVNGVQHPTVKPVGLMRWLVRLVTRPGGRVLEPFTGSGTTVEAAVLEGMTVVAIERELAYIPLIESRLSKPMQQSLFDDLIGGDAA